MSSNTIIRTALHIIILIMLTACQDEPESRSLPTVMQLPTVSSSLVTPTLRVLQSIPTQPFPPTLESTPTFTIPPQMTVMSLPDTPVPSVTALPTISPLPQTFIFGQSVQGRDLVGWRMGNGERLLMLVGGIHGGFEANTVDLMNELIQHFERTPADIRSGITLVIIPSLNPDGLILGRTLEGRFNANRVDLNRNWGCGWSEEAYFRNQLVSAGAQPFSEPESAALSQLILVLKPSVVLFYHSAASGIFSGECGGDAGSNAMSAVLGEATGYSYGDSFSAYPVTGTAPAWVNSQGIASADVELATSTSTEFDQNLRGVLAVQCWLLGLPGDCSQR